jgi:hypothetical protein
MDFNFWKSPLIKNLEDGKLPVIETEIKFSNQSIILLTIAVILIILTIVLTKKIAK